MTYHKPTRSETPPERDTLIYDGGCAVLHRRRRVASRSTPASQLDILPYEDVAGSGMLVALTPDEVRASVHFVTPEGIEYHGGEAAVRALSLVPGGFVLRVLDLPGLNYVRELGYEVVTLDQTTAFEVCASVAVGDRVRHGSCGPSAGVGAVMSVETRRGVIYPLTLPSPPGEGIF